MVGNMARLVTILLFSVALSCTVATDMVVYDLESDENGSGQNSTGGRQNLGVGAEGSGAGETQGSGRRQGCHAEGSGDVGSGGSGCDDVKHHPPTRVPTPTRATPAPSLTPTPTPCVKPADRLSMPVDEEKAMQRARCHSACLDNVRQCIAALHEGSAVCCCLLCVCLCFFVLCVTRR